MSKFRIAPIILILLVSIVMINPEPVWANTDTTGGTSGTNNQGPSYAYAFPITITASSTCSVQSVGVNWVDSASGNVRVALYSAGSGKPASLLGESPSTPIAASSGWQDIPVSSSSSITAGTYWVAAQISVVKTLYFQFSTESYYLKSYGSFDATWSASSNQLSTGSQWNMRVTYTCGSFTANHVSFTASPSGSTIQASLGYTNTLAANVIVVFSVKDSSSNLVDSPQSTATSGVTGGTASATSKSLSLGTYTVSWKAYMASDTTFSNPLDSSTPSEQQTVTTAPPPNDFIITVACISPSQIVNGGCSQTVTAGTIATYSLNIRYGSGLTATINLAVNNPPVSSGVIGTVTPTQVSGNTTGIILSFTTSVFTSATFNIPVTASSTSPSLSHQAAVQLIVTPPVSAPLTIHPAASQVIITVSWIGPGTAPVTLVGPNNTPVLAESTAIVYDRTSTPIGSTTTTYLHRVTFTLSPSPSSTQAWTAYISISATSGYSITTEVS